MTRKKEQRCVVAFSTTTSAVALRVACVKEGYAGRIIPLPPQIHAGCGLAWCCLPSDQEMVLALAKREEIPVEDCQLIMLYI